MGAVDSLIIEDGIFFFCNEYGIGMNFNSVGYSEEEVSSVITTYINSMMELSAKLKSNSRNTMQEEVQEGEHVDNRSIKSEKVSAKTKKVSAKTKKATSTPMKSVTTKNCKLTESLEEEYNKRISEALDAVDMDSDISKRGFSQQLRGRILHCAYEAGIDVSGGTSIEALVKQMNSGNIQRVIDVYDLYDQKRPAWLDKL